MNRRIEKVVSKIKNFGIKNILISDTYSIFYLTGKFFDPGERLLILNIDDNGNCTLYINKLFPVDDFGIKLVWFSDTDNPIDLIAKDISGVIGVDKNLQAKFLLPLMEQTNLKFILASDIVDDLRSVKDDEEIQIMIDSSKINDRAMEKMKNKLSENLSEREMAKYLKKVYEDLGSNEFSFDPIIAYGKNGADPHHDCDETLPKEGDSIIVDMGCIYNNYCSDMTRTYFYKTVSDKAREVYEIVLKANLAGIAAVKPGKKFSDIDKATRDVIEKAGYGEYFTHRTGHSIGLETHDKGDVSSKNNDILKVGNIFSIEPGIYIPNELGIRIEDLVLVTEDGCKVLNEYPKELTIIE